MLQRVSAAFLRYDRAEVGDMPGAGPCLPHDPQVCAVLPSIRGWIPLFDPRLDTFDAESAQQAARSFSEQTSATVLLVQLFDGRALLGALFEKGRMVSEFCSPSHCYASFFPLAMRDCDDPLLAIRARMLSVWTGLGHLMRFTDDPDDATVDRAIAAIDSPLLDGADGLSGIERRAMLSDFFRASHAALVEGLAGESGRPDKPGPLVPIVLTRIQPDRISADALARIRALQDGHPWDGRPLGAAEALETAHWTTHHTSYLLPAQPPAELLQVTPAPLVPYGLGFIGSLCRPQAPGHEIEALLGGEAPAIFAALKERLGLPLPFASYHEAVAGGSEAPETQVLAQHQNAV